MSDRSPKFLLEEGLELLKVHASARQLEILNAFLEELVSWSQAFNLTSKTSPSEIIQDHILDSTFVADFLPKIRQVFSYSNKIRSGSHSTLAVGIPNIDIF